MRLFLATTLFLSVAPSALAQSAYPDCAPIPASYNHVWHVDAVNGSTPDAAHYGVAVNGVMGTADGSAAHPFNSLAGVTQDAYGLPAGYGKPLLSTAGYDHYPHYGAHGSRWDNDWDPSSSTFVADPDRVNPGDQVVVHGGTAGNNYGSINPSSSGLGAPANVDANGNTDFVDFVAASGEQPPVVTGLALGGARGFIFDGFSAVGTLHQAGVTSNEIVRVTGSRDIIIQNGYVGSAASMPAWTNTAAQGATGAIVNGVLTLTTPVAPFNKVAATVPPAVGWAVFGPGIPANTMVNAVNGTAYTLSDAALNGGSENVYFLDPNSWLYNERSGISVIGGTYTPPALPNTQCVTITNETVKFIQGGIGLSQTYHSTATHNLVQFTSGDGIDNYSNSDATISNNRLIDFVEDMSGIHPDGIQLAYASMHGVFNNVVIKDNFIASYTDPTNPFPWETQGIDNTNEEYDHVDVEGNVVLISACRAIAFQKTLNSKFINNTIANDGEASSCQAWMEFDANPGAGSMQGSIVANNVVAGSVKRASCLDGATWYDNVVTRYYAGGAQTMTWSSACNGTVTNTNGKESVGDPPTQFTGLYIDGASPVSNYFRSYAPGANFLNQTTDLHPAPGSPLIGMGGFVGGPTDLNGLPLVHSDAGAYSSAP